MKETASPLMNEIRERLQTLEAKLAKRLDAMAVSRTTKVPWKALLLREVLSWRMADLARGAFENFEKERLASAIVLTRAAVETSAALWYLCGKVAAAIDAKTVGDIDDYLMRLMMGSKTESAMPQALNVLGFVDHVEKEVEGFRHQYDVLSEYAHPNWAGTSLLFLKHNEETRVTDFGANIRTENSKSIGVLNLSITLAMFQRSYNRLADLIPAFTALCESQFGKHAKLPRS
jgi:hypothetical protein